MSLIFGLAHAPGFIFRHAGEVENLGVNPSVLDALAYSIAVLAVSGILFGVIWSRTKKSVRAHVSPRGRRSSAEFFKLHFGLAILK
jgi:membrane protease YdiL (CAAX protease family)